MSDDSPRFDCLSQRRTAMPFVTLVKRPGYSSAKSAEDRLRHQLGMELGHAVDRVARDDREVRHAHLAPAALVDERHAAAALVVAGPARRDLVEEGTIDEVDDLQVARQDPLEERDRPDLERLGQQRVVGVREHAPRDLPGLLPLELVLVDQQPDQLA